jgi:sirohydrochlorin ferrochelatase
LRRRPAAVAYRRLVPDTTGHRPALLAVAHGTLEAAGGVAIDALLDRVRALRPGLRVRPAYLERTSPSVEEALSTLAGPVVVVPLLLATGYHATTDIPRALAAARPADLGDRRRATVAPALGPHPLLAEALADRLAEAGWRPGDAVVLAAAGSSDPATVAATEAQARLLAVRLRNTVIPGYGAAQRPDVPTAVATARRNGATRVAVATYLLAPGVFASRLAAAGADVLSTPLGPHEAVAQLVLLRYDEAVHPR